MCWGGRFGFGFEVLGFYAACLELENFRMRVYDNIDLVNSLIKFITINSF